MDDNLVNDLQLTVREDQQIEIKLIGEQKFVITHSIIKKLIELGKEVNNLPERIKAEYGGDNSNE